MSRARDAGPPTRGSPLMLVLLVVVLVPALLLGQLLGAGGAAILGGFVALFTLVSASRGSLRADLRLLAWLGPLIAVAAVAPRLLTAASRPVAFGLITLTVLVAGLLPMRGPRFAPVSTGLGAGTLMGYGLVPISPAQGRQFVVAGAVGLLVALVVRLALGLRDPGRATRTTVAGVLDGDRDLPTGLDAWLADGSVRWLGATLVAAGRYRLARSALEAALLRHPPGGTALRAFLDAAGERAASLAAAVRAHRPALGPTATPIAVPAAAPPPAAELVTALDDAEEAIRRRDPARHPVPPALRRRWRRSATAAVLRDRPVQLRHAVRAALAVLLALIASLALRPADPLLPALLMTTFTIVQATWRETLRRVGTRVVGVLCGSVLLVASLLLVPPAALPLVAAGAMAVGFWNLQARPAVAAAAMTLMAVGLNAGMRRLDPVATLVEYVELTAVALVVAGALGFLIVPGLRSAPLTERVDTAVRTTVTCLRALGDRERSGADRAGAGLRAWREARAARGQLVPDGDDLSDDRRAELDRLRESLEELAAGGAYLAARPGPAPGVLAEAAAVLAGAPRTRATPGHRDPDGDPEGIVGGAAVSLAAQARDAAAALRAPASSPR